MYLVVRLVTNEENYVSASINAMRYLVTCINTIAWSVVYFIAFVWRTHLLVWTNLLYLEPH
jgi:hypothetical protein